MKIRPVGYELFNADGQTLFVNDAVTINIT